MGNRVLIIDDEKLIVWSLESSFKEEGYTVFTAGCVKDALMVLANEEIDLVITDMRLPEEDGFEVLRVARAMERSPAVVMMSAFGKRSDRAKAKANGALEFFDKPVSVDKLLKVTSNLKQFI